MPKIKIIFLLVVIVIIVSVVSDVVEVKVHPGEISALPSKLSLLFKDKSTLEQGRAYIVKLKRRGEQLVIQDKEKRLELALLYVSTDAARLDNLIKQNSQNPPQLLPQAELLISSLEQVRRQATEAPVEVVASLKKESTRAFSSAQAALGRLQELHKEYTNIQQEFTRLTESLEKQIGELGLEKKDDSSVAGTQDEQPEPSKIPLKF